MKQPIDIHWKMPSPPHPAHTWHFWTDFRLDKKVPPADQPEQCWPSGTIEVLRKAFDLGLTRSQGWDLSEIEKSQQAPYLHAARLFRRGVAVKTHVTIQNPPVWTEGQYQLAFYDSFQGLHQLPKNGFWVIDSEVQRYWSEELQFPAVVLATDEKSKSLTTADLLTKKWQAAGCPQPWLIVGGGILADIAALAASLQRCSFMLIPTTLLAMADACVGGKTGVNFPPHGKNQLGQFAFPQKVMLIDKWLKTLPPREVRAGLSECLKHAFLKGKPSLWQKLANAGKSLNTQEILQTLRQVVLVKAEIISQDPTEKGRRVTLNFGHTLAHALETIAHSHTENPILHGEAVAWGMLFAAHLSHKLTGLSQHDLDTIKASLLGSNCIAPGACLAKKIGVQKNDYQLMEKILSLVKKDKKMLSANNQKSQWVLLEKLGIVHQPAQGRYTTQVQDRHIIETWQRMFDDPEISF